MPARLEYLKWHRRRVPEKTRVDFRHCGMCGAELIHENFVGYHVGTIFIAKGYYCFSCGFQDGARMGGKDAKNAVRLFDWRQIAATQGNQRLMAVISS